MHTLACQFGIGSWEVPLCLHSIFEEGVMETCFIELKTSGNEPNIIVGEIYRLPGTDENYFLNEYETILILLLKVNKEKKNLIIGTENLG